MYTIIDLARQSASREVGHETDIHTGFNQEKGRHKAKMLEPAFLWKIADSL